VGTLAERLTQVKGRFNKKNLVFAEMIMLKNFLLINEGLFTIVVPMFRPNPREDLHDDRGRNR